MVRLALILSVQHNRLLRQAAVNFHRLWALFSIAIVEDLSELLLLNAAQRCALPIGLKISSNIFL